MMLLGVVILVFGAEYPRISAMNCVAMNCVVTDAAAPTLEIIEAPLRAGSECLACHEIRCDEHDANCHSAGYRTREHLRVGVPQPIDVVD
jgi:hypothetical protein